MNLSLSLDGGARNLSIEKNRGKLLPFFALGNLHSFRTAPLERVRERAIRDEQFGRFDGGPHRLERFHSWHAVHSNKNRLFTRPNQRARTRRKNRKSVRERRVVLVEERRRRRGRTAGNFRWRRRRARRRRRRRKKTGRRGCATNFRRRRKEQFWPAVSESGCRQLDGRREAQSFETRIDGSFEMGSETVRSTD